ncbi:acetoacetate decarboxylase family protein [Actinosynnema sp. NPDC023587]|uniref:acetoacetate decarboxylase family protein n=1 Tax=Actinosynnema sp. NPDC023587 TaxID=3154695 RepID=UPI0033EA6CC8
MSYPAEPWHLTGSLVMSLFTVPAHLIPHDHIPLAMSPITVAGRAFACVAFVDYGPDGMLAYQELLVGVLVRHGHRVFVSVPQIWVDSETSLRGGRELWAIPKQRAAFGQGAALAKVTATNGPKIPGRWSVPLRTAQRLDGCEVLTRSQISGKPRFVRATWMFPAHGPLGYLAGNTPLASFALADMKLTFGKP